MNRTLDDAAAWGDNALGLTWKRFQGATLPSGTPNAGERSAARRVCARAAAGARPAVRRVTIADVAADAGVGVGTVSRVLNGSEQVRESTLRAVLESIDRLGYRP